MHASKLSSVDSVERKTCSTPYGCHLAATIEEFKKRPIEVGCFVFTRQAQHSRAAQECAKLSEIVFWLWKVLRIYQAGHSRCHCCPKLLRPPAITNFGPMASRLGSPLPHNALNIISRPSASYECHLYTTRAGRNWASSPVRPVWDLQSEQQFVLTQPEREQIRQNWGQLLGTGGPIIHVPLTAMLRPENILGGGFNLTASQFVPSTVQKFLTIVGPA